MVPVLALAWKGDELGSCAFETNPNLNEMHIHVSRCVMSATALMGRRLRIGRNHQEVNAVVVDFVRNGYVRTSVDKTKDRATHRQQN